MEGMVNISVDDEESNITEKLMKLLKQADVTCDDLRILTYSTKKLLLPQGAPDFTWTGQQIKTVVGQGKLYETCNLNDSSSLDSLPDVITKQSEPKNIATEGNEGISLTVDGITESSMLETNKPVDENISAEIQTKVTEEDHDKDFISAGTPTISFHLRHTRGSNDCCQNDESSPYRSYVELFEETPCGIDASEDEEISDLPVAGHLSRNGRNLYDILQDLSQILESNEDLPTTKINVTRSNPLDGSRRSIRRSNFNPIAKLSVRFADDFGTAEGAVDQGGPTRELFRLLLRQISELVVFSGPAASGKLVVLDAAALKDGLYHDVGILLAMALVHGGQFPKFLSQTAFNLLIDDNAQVSVADIPDYFLQAKIQQLFEATSSNQIQEVMDENSVLFEIAGCYKPVTVFSESARNKLVDDVVRFIVIGSNLPAIQQLRQGLQTFGLFQLMTEHSSQFFEVFCYGHTVKLTADQMEAIFNKVEYSDIGNKKRRKEECTISFWRDYLIDIEEGNSGVIFEDLLVFATGANHVPYLGFSPDSSIQFIDDEVEKNLPQANTCSMMLCLPIVKNYDQFKENMDFGILNSPGFGMA